MKALSLWQPWASAIAVGSKRVETRSWSTPYRGPIAIHAAKRFKFLEMCHFASSWNWTGALWELKFGMQPGQTQEERDAPLETKLPLGAIIAVCNLVDVKPTGSFTHGELEKARMPDVEHGHLYAWNERMMGDFSLCRFGWVLTDVKMIKPIPWKGCQGLFNIPDDLILQEASP